MKVDEIRKGILLFIPKILNNNQIKQVVGGPYKVKSAIISVDLWFLNSFDKGYNPKIGKAIKNKGINLIF